MLGSGRFGLKHGFHAYGMFMPKLIFVCLGCVFVGMVFIGQEPSPSVVVQRNQVRNLVHMIDEMNFLLKCLKIGIDLMC